MGTEKLKTAAPKSDIEEPSAKELNAGSSIKNATTQVENPDAEKNVGQANKRTAGQLEREVSQKMQALYKRKLGHQTGRVTCQLFEAKIAIVLENSLTQPVKLLFEENRQDLAQQIRNDLNDALQPLVKAIIADILGVAVLDVLSDTSLTTGRTAVVGILDSMPNVRNPEAISRAKKSLS